MFCKFHLRPGKTKLRRVNLRKSICPTKIEVGQQVGHGKLLIRKGGPARPICPTENSVTVNNIEGTRVVSSALLRVTSPALRVLSNEAVPTGTGRAVSE